MLKDLKNNYKLISSEKRINDFFNNNQQTFKILNAMEPYLVQHFLNNEFSLEICDNLGWTTETKLLLNVSVEENMFFNGMLSHFNEIYEEVKPVIGDMENTVVLFPKIKNQNFEKLDDNSAINLIARTAYFNNYNNGIIQREVGFREIPKSQKVKEIIQYCNNNESPNISDMVYDLQLELFDIDDIIDELEEKGIKLNVKY